MRFGIYTSDSFDQKLAGEGESEKELDFLDRSILDGDVHFVEILQELGRLPGHSVASKASLLG